MNQSKTTVFRSTNLKGLVFLSPDFEQLKLSDFEPPFRNIFFSQTSQCELALSIERRYTGEVSKPGRFPLLSGKVLIVSQIPGQTEKIWKNRESPKKGQKKGKSGRMSPDQEALPV